MTLLCVLCFCSVVVADPVTLEAEVLRDKIRGGLLGQMLGNLNGLPHEMRYIDEPGDVADYMPALPEGAWTDDDTDFEWVYVLEMQRTDTLMLPPARIAALWKERVNRRIWCSNLYARQLMDLGLEPPLTGNVLLNPWAEFNISGQFLCETFGLIAPGMPRTAARIGLNYTRVAIDGEPAQTTQLFTAMIATAFLSGDMEVILDAGASAVAPSSTVRSIVDDLRRWHGEHPDDWRRTRERIKGAYSRHDGQMRDRNGYELNTAATVAALLHGRGDFAETLRLAFSLGWDCDNSAATAGTILGVVKGYRWMLAQGWPVVDRYRNTTRDAMPDDETITSFADRLIDLAERNIEEHGGSRRRVAGRLFHDLPIETPGNVLPRDDPATLAARMRAELGESIRIALRREDDPTARARAAYLAICLDLAQEERDRAPEVWARALRGLQLRTNVLQALYHHSPVPAAETLRRKAANAGLKAPATRQELW